MSSTIGDVLSSSQIEAIRQAASDLLPDCQEFLAQLLKIDTTNPPGYNYLACAELIGNKLESFGYGVEYIDVPEELLPILAPLGEGLPRRNLIGRLLPSEEGRGPTLHVNGHFDVVSAGTVSNWKHDPFGAEVEDGRMYGRGSADQKSGIATQIFAAQAVRNAGLNFVGKLEQSAVVDEETTGNRNAGMGYLVETGQISAATVDAVIITEPLNKDNVCFAHRGTIWGEITFHGRAAHGSMPGLGINALEHACAFVYLASQRINSLIANYVDETVIPVEAQKASIAFTVIQAGDNINSVPDKATVNFDRRLVSPETLAEARQQITDVLDEMKATDFPDLNYEYAESYYTEPTVVPTDAPISLLLQDAIKLVTGGPAGLVTSPGSDDQRFLVHTADPPVWSTFLYGPGNISQAHITDESVDLENELKVSLEVMALAFAAYLGVEAA